MPNDRKSSDPIERVLDLIEDIVDEVSGATTVRAQTPPSSKVRVYRMSDGRELVPVTSELGLSIGKILLLARDGQLYTRINGTAQFRRTEVLTVLKVSVDAITSGLSALYVDRKPLQKMGA